MDTTRDPRVSARVRAGLCLISLSGFLSASACSSPAETSETVPPAEQAEQAEQAEREADINPAGDSDREGTEGERQRILGTSVSLIPPPGFEVAANFDGFTDPVHGSSLMLMSFDIPYASLAETFTMHERLAENGIRVVEAHEHPQAAKPGTLLRIEQAIPSGTVQKWMWLFGDDTRSIQVMGTCLPQYCATELPILERAVTSVQWDPEATVDPLEGLGFRLGDLQGLKVANRMSDTLLLTNTGIPKLSGQNNVMFSFGPSLSPAQVDDEATKQAFLRVRIAALPSPAPTLDDAPFTPVKVDGLDGYVALGSSVESIGDTFVYCVILFEPSGYYWFGVGMAPANQREAALERFDAITMSLSRVDTGD
ncbi:hypothetical protein G6O69_13925 [Pseudenhygromyxa sp. WMMC2535]|uniref:hypothetical protein n=1 Tax=Pseudenhygromyxa sp. WMMC2535 TaxID=2712867 RepID=UPI0015960B31|nr:hypothetical protein [Pseudenhygromyxa sp. WMMC2535]NVB38935.1 hypothetical protein [Pseudenhygromyxa sp. WMMC2535]